MTDNNAPIILQVVGNVCSLLLYHADSHYNSISHFPSVGELLCIFLNGEHNEKLFPADEIETLSSHGVTEGNSEAYRRWLGNYDREELLRIVNDVYLSGDKYIEAMKPSQRFRVYLNFKQEAFVSALTEQAISFMMPVLHRDPELLRDYHSEYLAMLLYTGDVSLKNDFKYAARFLQEKNIDVPSATAYMFVSTNELAFWLLRYVMENDKYINACEFCGRYFVPRRKTKHYCSDRCASQQRAADSFCGEPELRAAYMRIISNLNDKIKCGEKYQRPYCVPYESGLINPKDVRNRFLSDNAAYMAEVRSAYLEVQKNPESEAAQEEWISARNAYREFLQEQETYVKSLRLLTEANYWSFDPAQ